MCRKNGTRAFTNLLAGLAQCGACGGGLVVETFRTSAGKRRRSHYVCSRQRANGNCRNTHRLELTETNETILSEIEKHALTPEAIERVILQSEETAQEDMGDRLRRELKDIDKKIARF